MDIRMKLAKLAKIYLFFSLSWRLLLIAGCAGPTSQEPEITGGSCSSDKQCAVGEECAGAGCAAVRPTIYSHIQLASALLRPHNDDSEAQWRAEHADLLIGAAVKWADDHRALNPDVRLFEYMTNKYLVYETEAEDWAAENGVDVEDFYIHYKEDVYVGGGFTVPGYAPGVVPGWNPNRQPTDPPASATDRSHARVYDPIYSPDWPIANIANPSYRRFLAEYTRGVMDGTRLGGTPVTGPVRGIMVDNAIYYPSFNEARLEKTEEFGRFPVNEDHPYAVAYETFYEDLRAELTAAIGADADVMPNFGHSYFLSEADRFSQSVQSLNDWAWAEVWVIFRGGSAPTSGSVRVINYERDYERGIASIARQTRVGGRRLLGARDYAQGLGGSDRGRLLLLAMYYLVHNPNTFLAYESAQTHKDAAHVSAWQWNPAVAYDIGKPAAIPSGAIDFDGRSGTSEHYVMESGQDPYNNGLTYHLLARRFTHGLVLVKLLPDGSVVDDRSLTTHTLDEPLALLRPDGTPGQIVSEVSIRNNEGVILVRP